MEKGGQGRQGTVVREWHARNRLQADKWKMARLKSGYFGTFGAHIEPGCPDARFRQSHSRCSPFLTTAAANQGIKYAIIINSGPTGLQISNSPTASALKSACFHRVLDNG